MVRTFLLVGLGGCAGSMLRYAASVVVAKYTGSPYPYSTLAVNLIGCFLIGILFGYMQRHSLMQSDWWLVLATGFCGGFTTFSAFALENTAFIRDGRYTGMLIYTALSIVLGLLLCAAGIRLMQHQ